MYISCTDKCMVSSVPSFSSNFSVVKSTVIIATYHYKNIYYVHICTYIYIYICSYVYTYVYCVHTCNMTTCN